MMSNMIDSFHPDALQIWMNLELKATDRAPVERHAGAHNSCAIAGEEARARHWRAAAAGRDHHGQKVQPHDGFGGVVASMPSNF